MYGDACRLVDNNHILVLVDNANILLRDRRFVAVEGMRDKVAVFDSVVCASRRLTVDKHSTSLDSICVVLDRAVAKLVGKDLEDLTASPSLLAPSVVCVVIRRNSS